MKTTSRRLSSPLHMHLLPLALCLPLGLAALSCDSSDPARTSGKVPNTNSEDPGKSNGPEQGQPGQDQKPRDASAGAKTQTPVADKKRASTEAGRVALEGQLYKHPLGFRFRYPKSWKLSKAVENLLAFTPEDVLQSPRGPLEVILVLGDSADGITRPTDPRVAAYLDQQMQGTFPFLKRKGKPKALRLGGKAFSEHEWQGTNPLGKRIEGRAWATILEDSALGILALMPPKQFEKREAVLEAMAASFHFKEPARDPQLVGGWRSETSFSSGTFGSTTIRIMDLRANGTSTWGSRFMASMTHQDSGGNETGSTTGDSGRGDLLLGRWSAANKHLYITWKNGTEEEFGYYREGNSMLLTPTNGGKKQLWEKVR